ncbi:MAG: type I-E CRISPR-associated protein Cas6/Cse3/CasE [bacterium]
MYLSQLVLDLTDKGTMRVLSDVYRLHQFVMSGLSDYGHASRILFRVEPEVKVGLVRILVQSEMNPSWRNKENNGKGIVRVQTKEFSPAFREGALYRFRLRANPVVTRDGKRYGLIRDDSLNGWLKKKEESVGVSYRSVLAVDEGYATGKRRKGERSDSISIKMARFEGILAVTDTVRLSNALTNGVGPAKAFGCGLLSLARA